MIKIPLRIIFGALLISCLFVSLCQAEEQITITTYYPAPNGIYREMRANQVSIGSAYTSLTAGLADGILIVQNQIGIGTPTPTGKFEVRMSGNPNDYFRINNDVNVGLELRSGTSFGSPYIDFSDDAASNYIIRLWLVRYGGVPFIKTDGGKVLNTVGCIRYTFNPTSGVQTCPPGTHIAQAPLTPAGTDGSFLCCNYVNQGNPESTW